MALALGSVSELKPWLDEQESGMLTNRERPSGLDERERDANQ